MPTGPFPFVNLVYKATMNNGVPFVLRCRVITQTSRFRSMSRSLFDTFLVSAPDSAPRLVCNFDFVTDLDSNLNEARVNDSMKMEFQGPLMLPSNLARIGDNAIAPSLTELELRTVNDSSFNECRLTCAVNATHYPRNSRYDNNERAAPTLPCSGLIHAALRECRCFIQPIRF
ncbi:hypothetical protein EVAR_19094_1 [Eumeta japonica]|uniref:Uncharacterized protein n=1 Tax=Eumeta variegata TaxID=151549 RepID=A0A4C1UP90_EUMVA|nr:hypothetical protein EVAR_19094_1 [Eumeta japonica]